jgi:hypothetical protein
MLFIRRTPVIESTAPCGLQSSAGFPQAGGTILIRLAAPAGGAILLVAGLGL